MSKPTRKQFAGRQSEVNSIDVFCFRHYFSHCALVVLRVAFFRSFLFCLWACAVSALYASCFSCTIHVQTFSFSFIFFSAYDLQCKTHNGFVVWRSSIHCSRVMSSTGITSMCKHLRIRGRVSVFLYSSYLVPNRHVDNVGTRQRIRSSNCKSIINENDHRLLCRALLVLSTFRHFIRVS